MHDQENPLCNFIDSTWKCCSSLGGLVSSLISRHCRVLVSEHGYCWIVKRTVLYRYGLWCKIYWLQVGSPSHSPSEWEDNYSSEMEPIDISSTDSDSDSWDVEKYKALNDMDDSALGDSASSTNANVLPTRASSSSAGFARKDHIVSKLCTLEFDSLYVPSFWRLSNFRSQ